jgi:hypothetical protein
MLRYILAAVAALVLITASLIPDDAFARRGVAAEGSVAAVVACVPVASTVAACERAVFTAVAYAPVTLVAAIAWQEGLDLRIPSPAARGGPGTRVVR